MPERRPLDALFAPRSIAVIVADDQHNNPAHTIVHHVRAAGFGGTLSVVAPSPLIGDVPTFPTIATLPTSPDLAIISAPAPDVPPIIRDCVGANVGGAIVLSGGFRELGAAGHELEQQLVAEARRGWLRLIGPSSLGIMRPHRNLNASLVTAARSGRVAFLSQSGALGAAVLEWSAREQIGFSAFVALGGMLDVGWGDLLDYFGTDSQTDSILLYLETIGDARAFVSAAREVALRKPIIVLKPGRTAGAAQAATSHTGALVGSDAALDAALRRCGVVRVDTIAELFYMAEVLNKQPRPNGPRLLIVTNAGGPGVLAADALIGSGGQLATIDQATIEALDQVVPSHWSRANPIDLGSNASADQYAHALKIAAHSRDHDGLLLVLTPQLGLDPTRAAELITPVVATAHKPILASWMGGAATARGESILNDANVPTFPYPDTAARMFAAMWRRSDNLRGIYETPLPLHGDDPPDRAVVAGLIEQARSEQRTLLSEWESKQILGAYAIPAVRTLLATSAEQAVAQAASIGYPVALKLNSTTISHKSAVGGVRLDLRDADAVRHAFDLIRSTVDQADVAGVTVQPYIQRDGYELIVGSTIDPQWGPVLLFGAGGRLAEVWDDHALALPPLTTTLARRMIERTRIARALAGEHGYAAIDREALEELLVRFSYLVVEQPWIKQIEINPLLAITDADAHDPPLLALDARVVLHDSTSSDADLPKPAIRPYPIQYIAPWQLRDGSPVTIRPIRPEDEPLMVQFHHTLSERSVHLRYFGTLSLSTRIAHDRLVRLCFIDYDREMALVVDRSDPQTGAHSIIAVGRVIKLPGGRDAEWAILVSDAYQGHGLGTELLRRLIAIARDEQITRLFAEILPENRGMQRVAEKCGFRLRRIVSDHVVRAELDVIDQT